MKWVAIVFCVFLLAVALWQLLAVTVWLYGLFKPAPKQQPKPLPEGIRKALERIEKGE